ncbi:TPA: hypothetical protein ACQVJM_005370, partial [Serratia marcescens]
ALSHSVRSGRAVGAAGNNGPRGVQHGDNPLPVTQMILTTKLPAAADTLTLKEQLRLAAALFG